MKTQLSYKSLFYPDSVNWRTRGNGVGKVALCISLALLFLATSVTAAPFAKKIQFTQPDGTAIELWGQGDEFSAVFETLDGYTVVFDPTAKTYFYAALSADGSDLVSSNLQVEKGDPTTIGLSKHLRKSPDLVKKEIQTRFQEWDRRMENTERWNALKSVRQQTERAAANGIMMAPPKYTTTGNKTALCILIDFEGDQATVTQNEIENFCNGDNYSNNGNNGSVKQYFYDNSNNSLTYSNVVTAYVRIPTSLHPKSYYNDTSKDCGDQANLLIADAIGILKTMPGYSNDFDKLNADTNGNILCTNVFYAGGNGGAWNFGLWPHSSSLNTAQDLSAMGKKVSNYQITNIGDSLVIGTFCHENGHMLCGFPDLYDYDKAPNNSIGGAGNFCLMGSGNYGGTPSGSNPVQVSAYLKLAAGWATSTELTSTSRLTATLTSEGSNFNHFYRYLNPAASTEYFLIENRQQSGRDAAIPASGLAVWHIDELGDGNNQSLTPNSNHLNYECTLVQADNQWHFEHNTNYGDPKDLYYSGNTASSYTNTLNDNSSPNAHWWDGTPSGMSMLNISVSAPTMTFATNISYTDIDVKGNGVSIANRSSNPSLENDTDFGSDSKKFIKTYTIYNAGDIDLTLTGDKVSILGTNASDFAVSTQPLSPVAGGGNKNFDITFHPVSSGIKTATVSIENNVFGKNPYTFTIQGTGIVDIEVTGNGVPIANGSTPSTANDTDFGAVIGSLTKTYTIKNTGGLPLNLTGNPEIVAISENPDFIVSTQPATSVVAGGGSTSFEITFTPSSPPDTRRATVSIANNVSGKTPYEFEIGGEGIAPDIEVKGKGVLIANGSLTPSTANDTDFGPLSINGGLLTKTYTIKNTGGLDLNLIDVSISGTNASDFIVSIQPESTVAGGGSTSFDISFDPSASGIRTATVNITSNVSAYTFKIQGKGTNPGVIQFRTINFDVKEYATTAKFIVDRVGGNEGPASVKFSTSDGSAVAGQDYVAKSGTLSWPAGFSSPQTFEVTIKKDILYEGDEIFFLTLSDATGALLGVNDTDYTVVVNILDNDYEIDISNNGNGTTNPSGKTYVEKLGKITVSATPNKYCHFVKWTDLSGATIGTGNPLTIASVTSNMTVIANFEYDVCPATAVLTMAVSGNGTTIPAPGLSTPNTKEEIPITAMPDVGNIFAGWTVKGKAVLSTDLAKVTLYGDATVTANFISGTAETLLFSDNVAEKILLPGDKNSMQMFEITVPESITSLNIATNVGGGDCDIYARFAAAPTLEDYYAKSTGSGTAEKISIINPAAGTWYIMVYGYDEYSGVSLLVTLGTGGPGKVTGFTILSSAPVKTDRISMSWTAVSGATGYEVWRSYVNDVELATQMNVSGVITETYYDDIFTVPSEYRYYYWVRAVNAVDAGEFSSPIYGTNITSGVVALTKGTAVSMIGGNAGTFKTYSLTIIPAVPPSVPLPTLLEVSISGGTGDCDIDVVNPDGVVIRRSVCGSNNELMQIQGPISAGKWLIILYGQTNYGGVTLLAKYSYGNTAPLPPAGLAASDGLFDDRILLSWTASTNATSYKVYRAELIGTIIPKGDSAQEIADIPDCAYEDNDPSLDPGKTYYYYVKAKNAFGLSTYSTGNPGYLMKAPLAPASVTVSNGTYFDRIAVTWPKVADATSYQLYRSPSPTKTITVANQATSSDSCVITAYNHGFISTNKVLINGVVGTVAALLNGKTFEIIRIDDDNFSVSVTASAAAKTGSGGTVTVQTITGANQAASTGLCVVTAPGHGFKNGDFVLINGVVGTMATLLNGITFEIKESATDTFTVTVPVSTTVKTSGSGGTAIPAKHLMRLNSENVPVNVAIPYDSRLTSYSYNDVADGFDQNPNPNNNTYYYWVSAINGNGSSPLKLSSTVGSIKKTGPTLVTASKGTYFNNVKITWAAVAGATGYDVYRSENNTLGTATKTGSASGNTYEYYDINLDGVKIYYYWVRATFNGYSSDFSTPSSSGYAKITVPITLVAPVIKSVSKGEGAFVKVVWGEVPLAVSYNLYRKISANNIWEPLNDIAIAGLSYTDTSASAGQTYMYYVRAVNGATNSPFSASMSGYAAWPLEDRILFPTNTFFSPSLSGSVGNQKVYQITVPAGVSRLIARTEYVSGSCDLYAKLGMYPTTTAYNAKGATITGTANKILTVTNPAEGTWYVLLYGTGAGGYKTTNLHIDYYTSTNIKLTQVPVNDLTVPFTATFKGRVLDTTNTGIAGITLQVRNPITGITSWLPANTDATGYFTYSTTINTEGEHTFDFFFTGIPDNAKGTASHTVATRKGCLETNNFFDFSAYLPATPISLSTDLAGMQIFLDIRNGWVEGAIDTDYEALWMKNTIVAASTDAALLGKLDEGLYMFFYGVEGAGAGNDIAANSAFSAVPFVVHVASSKLEAVVTYLNGLGIIDNMQKNAILVDGKIGVVTVATHSNPGEEPDGDKNIYLLAHEQLDVLANLAAGNGSFPENRKYSDVLTQKLTVDLNGGTKQINVVTSAFVK